VRAEVEPTVTAAWEALPLACPRCWTRVTVAAQAAECPACGASYPVRDGVLHLRVGALGPPAFDPHFFPDIAAVEQEHYWFVTRQRVVLDALRSTVPDLGSRGLFDLGCGTGGLLEYLGRNGVRLAGACDVYAESLALARRRVAAPLVLMDEGRLPALAHGHSLVSLFDVLEHTDDDVATLRHIESILEPGGFLVLTVPAHPALFDEMDVIAHHRRRYRRAELRSKLTAAGFSVLRAGHFMGPLVPFVLLRWLARFASGAGGAPERRRLELRIVPVLNGLMKALLLAEWPLVRLGAMPFGSSLVAVARRSGRLR
jgi:SAM-dependent methyltransferase